MKIKLDENLSRYLKPIIEESGHDVSTAADEGLLGKLDPVVVAAAKSEARLLFTLDNGFGDLRKYPLGSHPGIILFRPRNPGPMTASEFVVQFVLNANLSRFANCLVIVEPGRVRVRRPGTDTEPA